MSSYSVDPLESLEDDIAWVDVGWDPALQTYFGQVYECVMEDGPPVFCIGQRYREVSTVAELAARVARCCDLEEDILGQLDADRMENQ